MLKQNSCLHPITVSTPSLTQDYLDKQKETGQNQHLKETEHAPKVTGKTIFF